MTCDEWSFMRDVFFSFYAGIMLVMLLYNLVLYFTVEDRSYLLYVLFLIGVALSQLFLAGYQGVIPGVGWHFVVGPSGGSFRGHFFGVTTVIVCQPFLGFGEKRSRLPSRLQWPDVAVFVDGVPCLWAN